MLRCQVLVTAMALSTAPGCSPTTAAAGGHGGRALAHLRVASGSASVLEPYAARLDASMTALERATGHPVDVEVDAALASQNERAFGVDIAREIEALVSEITSRARPGDVVFAGVLRDLRRIEVRYEPVSPSRSFHPTGGLLSLRIGVGQSWNAMGPLLGETDRRFDARYGERTPAAVPDDDVELYAWWLAREARRDDPSRGARAIVPLLVVQPRLAPAPRRDARLGVLDGMARLRLGAPPNRAAVPVEAATLAAFASFARTSLPVFDAGELDLLSRSIAAEPPLPGLDPLAVVMAAAGAWVDAGRPVFAFGEPEAALAKHAPLVGRVLSPGTLCPNDRLYAAIASSPDGLDALARRLDERADDVLRAVVFLHLVEATCEQGGREACPRVERTFCAARLATLPADIPPDVARRVSAACERTRSRR